jgi:predicted nucleotidyltransferase
MNYKNALVALVRAQIPGGKIYLFGSRARGTHSRSSDFDIALDTGAPIDSYLIGLIKESIENSNIPFFVDIVDFQRLDTQMQHEILEEGIVWES